MSTHGAPALARPAQQHQHSQRHQARQTRPPAGRPTAQALTATQQPTAAQSNGRARQPTHPSEPAETNGRRSINSTASPKRAASSNLTVPRNDTAPRNHSAPLSRQSSRQPTRKPDRIVEPSPNSCAATEHLSRANRFHSTGQPSDISQSAGSGWPGQPDDGDQHGRSTDLLVRLKAPNGGSSPHHRTAQANLADSPEPTRQAKGAARRKRDGRTDNARLCGHMVRCRLADHASQLDIAHPLSQDSQTDPAHHAGPNAQPSYANKPDPGRQPHNGGRQDHSYGTGRTNQRGHTGMPSAAWPHPQVDLARHPNRNGDAYLLTAPTSLAAPVVPPPLGERRGSPSGAVSAIAHERSLDVNSPSFRIVVAAPHVLCGQRHHTPETTPWTS